jgi:superfamily II DNA or RNA helicase
MGAIMARNGVEQGAKVNFFVPRTPLLGQTRAKMQAQGLSCGVVAGGDEWRSHENRHAPVQIISAQSLYTEGRDLSWLPQGKGTVNIVDECHITSFFRALRERCPPRETHSPTYAQQEGYWIKMTGTLWRLKPTESLGQFVSKDSLVCAPMPSTLMEWGYLVKPVYIRVTNTGRNILTSPEYALAQWKKSGQGRLTLAFCPNIPFARALSDLFNEEGIPAAWISADTPQGERNDILADLAAGRKRMVASYDCLSEGLDVPNVSCGMFLRATENASKYFQQLGRLVRPYSDPVTGLKKTDAIALDFVNIVKTYGRLEDLQVTPADLDVLEESFRGEAPLKQCPNENCGAWNPIQALLCEVCKQAFTIIGKEREAPIGDLRLDLLPAEKPQYAYYRRLLRNCFLNRIPPDEAIAQFTRTYGRTPPDAWRNCAVLPRGATLEERQKYAQYLEEVARVQNKSKHWAYHQMSLDLGL